MTAPTTAQTKRRYAREPKDKVGAASGSTSGYILAPLRVTKISKVIEMLQRDGGATLDEIVQSTGWQPHTARAALTGLKKKGHVIEREKRDTLTHYRIRKAS